MSYQPTTFRTTDNQSNFQQTSSRIVSSSTSAMRGNLGQNIIESRFQYDNVPGEQIIISGISDISNLRNLKNILLSLQSQWLEDGNKFVLSGNQKDQFNKRLFLLESQIDGLMKRKVNSTTADSSGRVLDYDLLMNQKEVQIVQLEKKIQNLEERLRRASKRQGQLEDQIVRLTSVIKTIQNPNITKIDLEKCCIGAVQFASLEEKYNRLRGQLLSFGSIYKSQCDKLRSTGVKFQNEGTLDQLLRTENMQVSIVNGVCNVVETQERVIEVPIQDSRTKHLIHMLAVQMKKYFDKYPKLRDQCDARLYQFFQQQLIDVIEADELERVVQIVKYVPEIVKVDNVYAYSSQKSRKVEFHLRVLVKALLQQLEKVKRKTGVILQIDQGIIGMINQQIMGCVNVDDILKVFRVVPKIVQVQKIVQKIVDRLVEVPQIVTVQKIVEKIVQVEKIKQVEKQIPVPIEVPIIVQNNVQKVVQVEKIIQKVVQVPTVVQRIVEVIKQVPKIEIVQKYIEKVVQVEKPIIVREVVNHVSVEYRQIQVIKQKIVHVQKVIQKIVQVPYYVEKIVEKIIRVPQIVQVQKIVQKIVKQCDVITAKQVENHIEVKHVIVDRIVQKPVIIIQRQERIVECPQIVEKIVQVTNTVEKPYEVKIIQEKIVCRDVIKQVERVVQNVVQVIRQVPKQVQRIVSVPVVYERIVKVTEVVQKPVVQCIQRQVPVIVELRNPLVVREPKTIEIQKIVNHYIEVPKPVKYIQEKIVEVLRHVDRIKQVKVPVQKIIEKMVEVPKVVQVQKIVQKIVVVPRVVQKIVQVPQIVERIVPKIMIEERIKQVEKVVQVPVIQDRVVEVVVQKNVYIEVEKIVEKVVDKLVQLKTTQQRIVNHQTVRQQIIEVIRQVPRDIECEKIVYNQIEVPKVIQIERQIIVPIEIPVPVERVVEKLVPITETIEKIVQVPAVIQKIVCQNTIEPQPVQFVRVEQKIVVDTKVRQVVKQVPYIRDQIKQVSVIKEKIVPVMQTCQQIITAKQIVEKVVEKTVVVPKIYEVQKIVQKSIEVPRIVEVEKIVPQLVNVNRYIQNVVEKIVQVPCIIERIKEVCKENEKVVEVRTQYENIREVERTVEKAVILQKFKEVVRDINHIEKVLQIVDRIVHVPVEIIAYEQKLVQVPYILEKIVEKIIVMPQIVEVLKYVHEVCEQQTLGVACGVQFATHEQKYKLLTKDITVQLDILLVQLRKMKISIPACKVQIELIEGFLAQLQQFILFPRIVQVEKQVEKIVQVHKDKIVQLPTQDQRSLKMELSLSLLCEKLILQMKRLQKVNPNIKFDLQDDVRLIFFNELDGAGQALEGDLSNKLKAFSDSVYRKFQSLGAWSLDHQLMLNSFLQQRFLMANLVKSANSEIEKSKTLQSRNSEYIRKTESDLEAYKASLGKLRANLTGKYGVEIDSLITNLFLEIQSSTSGARFQATSYLGDLQINDLRIQSLIREKDAQLHRLRDEIVSLRKLKSTVNNGDAHNRSIQVLQDENLKLKNQINTLRVERGSSQLITSYKQQIAALNDRILELEQQKSNLNAELVNLRNEYEVRISVSNFNNQVDIKNSGVTHYNGNRTTYNDRNSDVSNTFNSESKINQNLTSPVTKFGVNSGVSSPKEESFIKMVDSKIQQSSSTVKAPTYGMTDSRQSGASSSSNNPQGSIYGIGVNQVTSTYQTPGSSYQSSSISGSSGVYGNTSLSGSGVKGYGVNYESGINVSQSGPTYQIGSSSSGIYQSGTGATYQAGNTGNIGGTGLYQSGTGSGIYQSGTNSAMYKSGTGSGAVYQAGTTGTTYQPGVQSGSYGSYQTSGNSAYRVGSGVTGTTGTTGTTGATSYTGSSGFSSSTYRQEKK